METKVFDDRTARREYVCAKCGKPILKGSKYIDIEHKYWVWNGVNIRHTRTHQVCPRAKIKLKFTGREPVTYAGYKEWLIGKMIFFGEVYLLTQDWDESQYHKRESVYDCDGNEIKPEMVEV